MPAAEDVAQVGLPADLTGAVFFGVMAPGGTPEPIVAKLNADFNEVLADPATAKKLVDLGFVLVGGSDEADGATRLDILMRAVRCDLRDPLRSARAAAPQAPRWKTRVLS